MRLADLGHGQHERALILGERNEILFDPHIPRDPAVHLVVFHNRLGRDSQGILFRQLGRFYGLGEILAELFLEAEEYLLGLFGFGFRSHWQTTTPD